MAAAAVAAVEKAEAIATRIVAKEAKVAMVVVGEEEAEI